MACSSPVLMRGRYAPCSRCEACRKARAFVAVSRLLIEAFAHERVDVCTLTYRDEQLPDGGSVSPSDVVGFRKRLRERFAHHCACDPGWKAGPRLRFFIVGEYGGRFGRPHCHAIIFGADRRCFVNGVAFTSLVHDAWGKGHVDWAGGWCAAAAGYCAGYIVKGHTVAGLDVLGGRHPEFALWPRAPGLGVPGLSVLLPMLIGERDARQVVDQAGELPFMAEIADRSRPIGGYLAGRLLRDFAGCSDEEVSALKERRMRAKSSALRDAWLDEVLNQAVAGNPAFVDLLCPT